VLFAALPGDYTHALLLFHLLQILLFLAAVVLLGRLYRYQTLPLLCLALLFVLASGPLSSDQRVGNLGCFQLFALTALLALADRLPHAPRPAVVSALLLTGLILLVIAKPNVALVGGIMAAHVWSARGSRSFAIAAVPAVLGGAAAVAVACVYFHSWTTWPEWYRFVHGANPYMLVRPVAQGNYSTPLLLSSWIHADVWRVAAVVAAGLAASVIAVIAASATREARTLAALGGALRRVFDEPRLAMAIGITLTIALSPLFWYHYYLLVIIPGLWLLNTSSGSLCGLAALGLSAGILNVLFLPFGLTDAAVVAAALSWLPLWVGILLRLYERGTRETAVPSLPSTGASGDDPRPSPRSRRGSPTRSRR